MTPAQPIVKKQRLDEQHVLHMRQSHGPGDIGMPPGTGIDDWVCWVADNDNRPVPGAWQKVGRGDYQESFWTDAQKWAKGWLKVVAEGHGSKPRL
jgi:hypothetical protein